LQALEAGALIFTLKDFLILILRLSLNLIHNFYSNHTISLLISLSICVFWFLFFSTSIICEIIYIEAIYLKTAREEKGWKTENSRLFFLLTEENHPAQIKNLPIFWIISMHACQVRSLHQYLLTAAKCVLRVSFLCNLFSLNMQIADGQ
jgi:hypothetical protein